MLASKASFLYADDNPIAVPSSHNADTYFGIAEMKQSENVTSMKKDALVERRHNVINGRLAKLQHQGTLVLLMIWASGCASLNSRQKAELELMKQSEVYTQEKNPGSGTALGFLPGGGSFYTHQWGLGVLDLLTWPFSILWDPISGYEGSLVMNYDASRITSKRKMKKEIDSLDDQIGKKEITEDEYRRERKKIEEKYQFD